MQQIRRIGILALTMCAGALVPAAAARAGSAPSRALRAAAVRDGSVRVLVRIGQSSPEGDLAGPAAVGEQRAAIARAEDALASELAARDATIVRRFATIPYVAVEAGPDGLDALAGSSVVRAVLPDTAVPPALDVAGPMQQADAAWAAGFDGTGQTVAVLDTGADTSHPFIADKIVAEACFSARGNCPNGQTSEIGTGAGVPGPYSPDECGHGTHVSGIVAGVGTEFSGIARGATLIPVQVFSRFADAECGGAPSPCARSYTSDEIAGLEWVLEQRARFTIAAVNMSLGGGRFQSQSVCDAENAPTKEIIDNLRSAGIVTVIAAGNDSYPDALAAPGCISSAVSVGATTRDDNVAGFSNSAGFLTLLAIGNPVLSSLPGGIFGEESGTSQATPMVSGAFAILRQKRPTATIDQIVSALQTTGLKIHDPRNGLVKSRIRIKDALDALAAPPSPTGVQITPDGRFRLVSKDVGAERWAITFDDQTGYVTGNVFDASGGDPKFLSCTPLWPTATQSPSDIRYACEGAGPCLSAPCDPEAWTFIAETLLPFSFFDPPPGAGGSGGGGAVAAAHVAGIETRASGLQVTPDGGRTLISKDVGGERWAIGRESVDGTVTGNVFRPDGGDPQFVYCTQLGVDPDGGVALSCSGAARCAAEPCSPDHWAPLGQVTLPASFFEPPAGPAAER